MSAGATARRDVERARARRDRAAAEGDAAATNLIAACQRARLAGVSVSEIARLAGLSRDGLYKLLARHGAELTPPRRHP